MTLKSILITTLVLSVFASQRTESYQAPYAKTPPTIDGVANETAWDRAKWHNIDQLTLGSQPSEIDFQGRFKIIWKQNSLFIMAEIIDDILIDTHADPLDAYWEDDTFEVFLDEDKSGGDHLNNYNAFAYHIGLDNQAVDIDQSGNPRLFNTHVDSVWRRSTEIPNVVVWEVKIDVYSDKYVDNQNERASQHALSNLYAGKEMGFMVAYCDSDSDVGRDSFIGSHDVPAVNGDKNRAYIDASVFDNLILVK